MTMNDNIARESMRREVSKYVEKRVYLDPGKVKTIRTAQGKLPVSEGDFVDYLTDGRAMYNGTTQLLTIR